MLQNVCALEKRKNLLIRITFNITLSWLWIQQGECSKNKTHTHIYKRFTEALHYPLQNLYCLKVRFILFWCGTILRSHISILLSYNYYWITEVITVAELKMSFYTEQSKHINFWNYGLHSVLMRASLVWWWRHQARN